MLSVQTLVRIAEALNTEPGDLIDGLRSDMFSPTQSTTRTAKTPRTA